MNNGGLCIKLEKDGMTWYLECSFSTKPNINDDMFIIKLQ